MPLKLREPGVFETSYRKVHRRTKREAREAVRVIVQIRRAALVAQLKGGK